MDDPNIYMEEEHHEDDTFSFCTGSMNSSCRNSNMDYWGAYGSSSVEQLPQLEDYNSFYSNIGDMSTFFPFQEDYNFGHGSCIDMISNESIVDDDDIYHNQPWEFTNKSECCSGNDFFESDMSMSKDAVVRNEENENLSFESISRYFYIPITEAARKLNVGLTLLKKRCRELGIERWPQRKLLSLLSLIKHLQGLVGEEGDDKVQNALNTLEHERKCMEIMPCLQIQKNTKKLRQACFKANYKRKKQMKASGSTNEGINKMVR